MLQRPTACLINHPPFDIKIYIKYDHKINTTSLKRKRRWWGWRDEVLAIKGHVCVLMPPWSFMGVLQDVTIGEVRFQDFSPSFSTTMCESTITSQ